MGCGNYAVFNYLYEDISSFSFLFSFHEKFFLLVDVVANQVTLIEASP